MSLTQPPSMGSGLLWHFRRFAVRGGLPLLWVHLRYKFGWEKQTSSAFSDFFADRARPRPGQRPDGWSPEEFLLKNLPARVVAEQTRPVSRQPHRLAGRAAAAAAAAGVVRARNVRESGTGCTERE